ncbi:hypothetical protein ABBQ38_010701 [Trebouxia sp. C0009 RCD-2024]
MRMLNILATSLLQLVLAAAQLVVAQEPLVLRGLSVTHNEIENCFASGINTNVTVLDDGDLEGYCNFVKHMVSPPADDAVVADYVALDDIMLSLYHRSRMSKPNFGRKVLENDPYTRGRDPKKH